MKKIISLTVVLIIMSLLTEASAQAAKQQHVSRKKAMEWFKNKEWAGGLQISPDKSIDVQEFYLRYHANKANWDKAFQFLREQNLKTLEKGRHEIDGEKVFATVTVAPSKNIDNVKWESHRRYADIQYVIEGEELIGVHPVSTATVVMPYNEKNDVANYSANGKYHKATPESFFIFFPTDAHRPNIISDDYKKDVKKIVVKVRLDG